MKYLSVILIMILIWAAVLPLLYFLALTVFFVAAAAISIEFSLICFSKVKNKILSLFKK